MNTSLKNPYYFIKDGVIFNILTNNSQKDPCGKHYKTFDTEIKNVKKGTTYYDKNGNIKIAEEDGNVEVSLNTMLNEATITANKSVFPFFEIKYKNKNEDIKTIIYWLDDYISDGDKMVNNKFVKTIHNEDEETEITFLEFYKKECLNRMLKNVLTGMSLDNVKKSNPFLFINTKTKINGEEVTIIESDLQVTDEEINEIFKEKIKEYGDKILKIFNKTCLVNINE
jgi:hypothetical protein